MDSKNRYTPIKFSSAIVAVNLFLFSRFLILWVVGHTFCEVFVQKVHAAPGLRTIYKEFSHLVWTQVLFILLVSTVLVLSREVVYAAAFYCGAVAFCLPMALGGWMCLRDRQLQPAFSLLKLYAFEMLKIIVSVTMLCWALMHAHLSLLGLMLGYFLMMVSVWVIPGCLRGLTRTSVTV